MLKYFLFIAFFYSSLFSMELEHSYDVSYGMFGKLGNVNAKVVINKEMNYIINVTANTTGLIKSLTNNLIETYTSIGIYKKGRFIPNKFKKITSKDSKIKIHEYLFDYKNKQVTLKKTVKKLQNGIWKESIKQEIVKYWSKEDLLSLFFNLKYYLSDFNTENKKSIPTIGAGKSNDGKIDIQIPVGEKRKEIAKLLNSNSNLLIVKIYNKLFASSNGEMYLHLNEDGLCDFSILKDVLFFGDIVGKKN